MSACFEKDMYPGEVPDYFMCPISMEIMHDPVTTPNGSLESALVEMTLGDAVESALVEMTLVRIHEDNIATGSIK
ncbi:Zinc finger, RING/FYVE/PHD-type [Phytophthora cactorum]|nr:Zinc finger, RING/FYVE/PHD-type [Phytophthora cactorum]